MAAASRGLVGRLGGADCSSNLSPVLTTQLHRTSKMSQPNRGNKVLTMETLNPNIKLMEYAVRGPIVARAAEIEKELEKVSFEMQGHL